jgi:hypothetical protein
MSSDIGGVIAQLVAVRDALATAAVTAMRAGADADHAHAKYREAADGTSHSQMQQALTDIRTAGDKTARYARLLEDARTHLKAYLDQISPGAVSNEPHGMPDGERLVEEAADRESRAARHHRSLTTAIAEYEGEVKKIEGGTRKIFSIYRDGPGPGGQAVAGVPSEEPAIRPIPAEHSANPISDAALVVAATALVGRVAVTKTMKYWRTRERKKPHADQAGAD